jgi:crotonobetainyl-CoA:carnitine CoA-transferase CaiB-like acyl-CoA transferase
MALILDLTSPVGAYGARLLVELGHEVVRIESPTGDALRKMGPYLAGETNLESGAFHEFLNAGKRSFSVDLATSDGRAQLLALVARADAVVASLPLPIDEAALLATNPELLIVKLDDGPPELCVYASSGLLAITGEPDAMPVMMGGHIPHSAVGLYLVLASAAALFAKQMTGKGQIVEVSAAQALAALAEQVWVEYASTGETLERRGSRGGITALAGALPCADGHWMISVPPTPAGWQNFVEMVPDPVFKDDHALADEANRRERKDEILDRISAWSTHQQKDEIVTDAQRRHIPAAPVTTPLDLVNDPQLLARNFLQKIEHPRYGRINFPVGAIANIWGGTPAVAPTLGQDNKDILARLEKAK